MTKKDPWTDSDPQPGDFDAEIELMGPEDIQRLGPDPNATLTRLAGIDANLASELARVAAERGTTVTEVIADLWRSSELARR